jgi:hypothetical protein
MNSFGFNTQFFLFLCYYRAPSAMRRIRSAPHHRKPSPSSQTTASSDYDADESDNDDLSSEYHHVALQLLDLMQTLHTR